MTQVSRKLRARQTQERIAASAGKLFAERGYQATPMDAIAADAGVAVQTVYFAFRTKPELLIAAYDQAVLGGMDVPRPDEQDWYLRALAEPNGAKALSHFVDGTIGILVRSGPLLPVMVSSPDEEVRRAFHDRQQGRYEAYRHLVRHLVRHGQLKPGLDEQVAADVVFALFSPEVHSLLCATRGWTPEEFRAWMIEHLRTHLLAAEPGEEK